MRAHSCPAVTHSHVSGSRLRISGFRRLAAVESAHDTTHEISGLSSLEPIPIPVPSLMRWRPGRKGCLVKEIPGEEKKVCEKMEKIS